jgi:hypothetical protein
VCQPARSSSSTACAPGATVRPISWRWACTLQEGAGVIVVFMVRLAILVIVAFLHV